MLDYDGTIVSTDRRLEAPTEPIMSAIRRLLDEGVSIALATGRGGSVGEEFRKHLTAEHCARVLVGYYNGALIVPLSIDLARNPPLPDAAISKAYNAIRSASDLFLDEWLPKQSAFQITIDTARLASPADGMLRLREIVETQPDLKMLRSGHSIDICPTWAAKSLVLEAVKKRMTDSALSVLAIGDSGDRQGNDYELLGADFGLSVDRVCDRELFCWNLLPGGISGPDGLLRILSGMHVTGAGRARLDVSVLGRL